jgi:hypothetical protein
MRSHESGPMITVAELPAPMGLVSGAPRRIPGNVCPTDCDSWPEPMVVPVVGADTTGEVGDADDVAEDEETVEELDPGG